MNANYGTKLATCIRTQTFTSTMYVCMYVCSDGTIETGNMSSTSTLTNTMYLLNYRTKLAIHTHVRGCYTQKHSPLSHGS